MSNSSENMNNKPECKYGVKCYQRNKQHTEKYKHPPEETEETNLPVAKRQRTENGNLKQQNLNFFFSKKSPNKIQSKNDKTIEKKSSSSKTYEEPVESVSEANPTEGSDNDSTTEITTFTSVPVSNEEYQRIIEKLFFVRMPYDFFSLWEFCKIASPRNPSDALKTADLVLIGPFDVLNGSMKDDIDSSIACRHWRYFYDPPEFQTVLKSNKNDLLHFGYYRDDPKELPVFVGCNKAAKDVTITPVGENIFAAINWCMNHSQDTSNPFQKVQLSNLKTEIQKWTKDRKFSLNIYTENMRKRDKIVVAKTFHHAGIVVPYNKKTELGYRPLSKTPTELSKILNQIENSKTDSQRIKYISELHEVITWANIAVDEGDFGTTLELGIDLFCFDSKYFNSMILQLLTSSYKLLKRNAFANIIKAHLENRKKGSDLSILEENNN